MQKEQEQQEQQEEFTPISCTACTKEHLGKVVFDLNELKKFVRNCKSSVFIVRDGQGGKHGIPVKPVADFFASLES